MPRRIAILGLVLSTPLLAQGPGRPFEAPEGIAWEKDVEFARVGDRALLLDVLRPAESPEGKMPAVVFVHGGGFVKGTKDQGLMQNLRLAQAGYYTVSIEYRLAPQAPFPAAVEDCKAAVRWVRANADRLGVDPEKIGIWGTSAGGHLASFVGTSGGLAEFEGTGGNPDVSSRVACVVDGFGPSNFVSITEQRGQPSTGRGPSESGFFGGRWSEELGRRASPITHVSADDPPFLIIHGSEDPVVPYQQSEEFFLELKEKEVDALLLRVTGAKHGWGRNEEVERRIVAFFDRHLRGAEVEVSTEPVPDTGRGQPREKGR